MSRQMPGVACFQLPAFCGIKELKSANLTFIGLSAAFCHFSIGHPLGVTAHVAQSREVRPSCTRQVFEVAFLGDRLERGEATMAGGYCCIDFDTLQAKACPQRSGE